MSSRALKEMLLYGAALLMFKGASLITLPFMAHHLSVEQIGQLELLATTTVLFALFSSLAMHESLYRFIATIDDHTQQREQTNKLYTTAIVIALTVVVGFWLLYQGSRLFPLSLSAIHYFSPTQWLLIASSIVLESALAISLAWLRLQGRADVFFKLSLLCVSSQVSLILLVVRYYPSVTTVFSVGVFTALLQCCLLHLHHRFHFQLLSFKQLKHYLRYCLPIMWSSLIAFGLNGGERWIVAEYVSLEMLGQYAIALKFSLAVGILLQPFHMWWMPKRFECWQTLGATQTAKNSQIGIIYAGIVSVGIVWLAKWFISLYLPSQYQLAADLVVLTVAAMLFKELVEIVNIGVLKKQQTKTLLRINIAVTGGALLALFIALSLFHWRSIWLVIPIVSIAQMVRFALVLSLSQRLAPLPYPLCYLMIYILLTTLFLASALANLTPALMLALAIIQPTLLLFCAHQLGLLHLPLQALRLAWQRFRV